MRTIGQVAGLPATVLLAVLAALLAILLAFVSMTGSTPMSEPQTVDVERIGGFGAFGLPGSRIRSHGQLPWSQLSAADRQAVEQLLARKAGPPASKTADGFRYRITVKRSGPPLTLEAAEDEVPVALRNCVSDELI